MSKTAFRTYLPVAEIRPFDDQYVTGILAQYLELLAEAFNNFAVTEVKVATSQLFPAHSAAPGNGPVLQIDVACLISGNRYSEFRKRQFRSQLNRDLSGKGFSSWLKKSLNAARFSAFDYWLISLAIGQIDAWCVWVFEMDNPQSLGRLTGEDIAKALLRVPERAGSYLERLT